MVLKSSKTATVAAKTNSLFSMFGGSKNGSTGRAGEPYDAKIKKC